jgi:DNA polymerase-3 subunit beta
MKFEAQAELLAEAAQAAAKTIDAKAKPNIPVLGNLLLTADGNTVSFIGTNLDHWSGANCAAEVTQAGAITIDARFSKWAAALAPDTIIKATLANGHLHCRAGRGSARILTLPSGDFPLLHGPGALPENGPFAELNLSAEHRRRLLMTTASAISDETTRYYLNGSFIQLKEGRLRVVSTDGHRLLLTSIPFSGDYNEILETGVIIPGPACHAISKMDDAVIRIDRRAVEAIGTSKRYASKLIDGTFPDYSRVIPSPSENHVTLNRVELIATLERLKVLGEGGVAIRFDWGNGTAGVRLSLGDAEAGNDQLEAADCAGASTLGLKAKYAIEVLEALSGDVVTLDSEGPGAPVRITAPDDAETIGVIMPVRI